MEPTEFLTVKHTSRIMTAAAQHGCSKLERFVLSTYLTAARPGPLEVPNDPRYLLNLLMPIYEGFDSEEPPFSVEEVRAGIESLLRQEIFRKVKIKNGEYLRINRWL